MREEDWCLTRLPSGELRLQTADGEIHDGVMPVRAFPVSGPQEAIAVIDAGGRELLWVATLAQLGGQQRRMLEEALAGLGFLPEIQRLVRVSRFTVPVEWTVDTDHGRTRLQIRGEEDIRRLAAHRLLVTDDAGIHYLIKDVRSLDRQSQRLIEHFL
jgi:hypothetical protein